MRRFNTAGPCRADLHYLLPPHRRMTTIRGLVENQAYFLVHAPRQVGKTTGFLSLAAELTVEGRFVSALLSLEMGAFSADDVGLAEGAILSAWREDAEHVLPKELRPPPWPSAPTGGQIASALAAWARACPRPLVLFLDEVDAVQGDALLSVLRQLRSGFKNRPESFPWSMALIGLRDVRDYLLQAGSRLGTASPFNIKEESITLRNFTADEVGELYAQHTAETGQIFTPAAVDRAFHLSQGQPWLVNALARQMVEVVVPDRGIPLDTAHVDRASEILIERRDTHIDSLLARLREPRVAPSVAAVLLGDIPQTVDYGQDDFRYVLDLGLLRIGRQGAEAANPIYQEVLARTLSYNRQMGLSEPWWKWKRPGGGLDFPALLDAFLVWWRENSGILYETEIAPYREAAAHLAMMGFLQRVTNGDGRIHREYAADRKRVDLVVEYADERFVLSLKRVPPRHSSAKTVEDQGIAQLAGYLDTLGIREGWLVIFDQRPDRSWEERLWRKDVEVDGRIIHAIGA